MTALPHETEASLTEAILEIERALRKAWRPTTIQDPEAARVVNVLFEQRDELVAKLSTVRARSRGR
jgi:hypothetical protein